MTTLNQKALDEIIGDAVYNADALIYDSHKEWCIALGNAAIQDYLQSIRGEVDAKQLIEKQMNDYLWVDDSPESGFIMDMEKASDAIIDALRNAGVVI